MRKIFILMFLLLAVPCSGAVISVKADGSGDQATIMDAVKAAEGGDEIVLSAGIYTGEGNRDIDFGGKSITLRSSDPGDRGGAATVVIDCQGSEAEPHRAFYFHSGEDEKTVIKGLTIKNGFGKTIAYQGSQHAAGGAILCESSSPSIINCYFVNNRVTTQDSKSGSCYYGGYGGAIFLNNESNMSITNCTFTGNIAYWGGAIHCGRKCGPKISNCKFAKNIAAIGGAIFNYYSQPVVSNSSFAKNRCSHIYGGGAVYSQQSNLSFEDCSFYGNHTPDDSGGLVNSGGTTCTLKNCKFSGNSKKAIALQHSSTLNIENCNIPGGKDGISEDNKDNTINWKAGETALLTNAVEELNEKLAVSESQRKSYESLYKQLREELEELKKLNIGTSGKSFMEVISVEPASPAVLEPGQPVYVKVRYDSGGKKNIKMWIRPGGDDKGVERHTCSNLKETAGEYEGWFYFDDRAAEVKSLNLRMVTNKKGDKSHVMERITIFEDTAEVDFKWKAPRKDGPYGYTVKGASVKLGTVRPEMPAVLKVGEKFLARFQYNSGVAKPINIRIWPGKQKDGNAPPQDKSQINNRKGHSSQDQIYFSYDQPGSVSEMKFRMIDNETGRFLIQYTFPVDVTWVENEKTKSVVVTDAGSAEAQENETVEPGQRLFESIFKLGEEHYDSGRYDKAKELFMYLSDNSTVSEIAVRGHRWAVYCEIMQGNKIAADEEFEAFWVKHSSAESFIVHAMGVGREYVNDRKCRDLDRALKILDRLLKEFDGHEESIRLLKIKSDAYVNMEKIELADAMAVEIIRKYPENKYLPDMLNRIAYNYIRHGYYKRSNELYLQMLKSDCDKDYQVLAHSGIGMCAVWLGDYALADAKVELLLKNYKGNEKLGYGVYVIGEEYYRLANKTYRKDQHQGKVNFGKAITIWQNNIKTIPDKHHFSLACYYTAYAYLHMQELKKSIYYYQMVVDKTPKFKQAWNAQHQITLGLDRMYRNKEMTLEEVKPLILESCEKFRKNYPDCFISGAWKKYYDKYINL